MACYKLCCDKLELEKTIVGAGGGEACGVLKLQLCHFSPLLSRVCVCVCVSIRHNNNHNNNSCPSIHPDFSQNMRKIFTTINETVPQRSDSCHKYFFCLFVFFLSWQHTDDINSFPGVGPIRSRFYIQQKLHFFFLFFFSGKSVKLKPPAHLLLVVSTIGSGVVAGIVLESRISTYIFGNELKISAHLCRIQKWCRNTLQNVLIARSRQDRSWSGPWFYLFIFYIYKIVPQTIELPVHILLAPFSSGAIFMLWVRHLEGDLKG